MWLLSSWQDGAARRKEPTAELLTTLWAHALRTLSREEQAGTLLAARANQLLLSISLWLRRSIGIDVVPCADVVVSAGTEDEHGVPTPAPYAEWSEKEIERLGSPGHGRSPCDPMTSANTTSPLSNLSAHRGARACEQWGVQRGVHHEQGQRGAHHERDRLRTGRSAPRNQCSGLWLEPPMGLWGQLLARWPTMC